MIDFGVRSGMLSHDLNTCHQKNVLCFVFCVKKTGQLVNMRRPKEKRVRVLYVMDHFVDSEIQEWLICSFLFYLSQWTNINSIRCYFLHLLFGVTRWTCISNLSKNLFLKESSLATMIPSRSSSSPTWKRSSKYLSLNLKFLGFVFLDNNYLTKDFSRGKWG